MGQIITDDFNRADSTGLGANWTKGSNSQFNVVSNKAVIGANDFCLDYYSGAGWTGGADQYAEAAIQVLESGKDMGPFVRASGSSNATMNGYLFAINDIDAAIALGATTFSVALFSVVTGLTFNQLGASVTGVTVNANDVIRIEVTGTGASTVLVGKINGVTIITRTDAAGAVASGKPGQYVGSGSTSSFDTWAAGDFASGVQPDTNTAPLPGLGAFVAGQRTAGTRARLAQQQLFHLPQDTSFVPPPVVGPYVPPIPGEGVAFRESKLDYANRALYSTVTLWGGGGDITILQPDTYQPPVVGERALQASTTAFRQRSAQAQRLSWLVDNAVTSAAAVVPPYQAPLLGERLLASALRQQAVRAQLATGFLIFTPSDGSTALPQPDTYQPPIVGERALQTSTTAYRQRSTQSNALLWPVAQDPAFAPVTVTPVPGVGAWAAALQRQATQARLATTLLILAPSVTSGLTVQPDAAIQPIPGLGAYAASQQIYRLNADRANRLLWTAPRDGSVALLQPETYQPPLVGDGHYRLRALEGRRRAGLAQALLMAGTRDLFVAPAFSPFWAARANTTVSYTSEPR